MQKSIIILGIILSFSFLSQAQESKETVLEESYLLNPFQSVINWKGSYLFKFAEHNGTVEFKKGKLFAKDGAITGGTFVIDMTTITNEEHRLHKSNGPVEHLKNSDFFDVTLYPEARLDLNKVTYYSNTNEHRFEGDLTIKGITKSIMIKARVDDIAKTIKTKFKINRRDWNVNYTNKFKDDAISDAMEFDITLQFE
ncbi:MAG: polyisoprenoid-binding protein YceI [Planctomycetota bacterium]|jgi:polyisoprenoid-binding protein YceI|uniref:YceI family protein n=1 Tax=Patiriisocius sp. Uisw_047 TaxID=3230969 RepID=UPI0039EC7970